MKNEQNGRMIVSIRKLAVCLKNARKEKSELENKLKQYDEWLRKAGARITEWQTIAELQHDDIVALEKTLMQMDERLEEFSISEEDVPMAAELIEANMPKRYLH
ncbi:MAG: hypothetical protein UW30_C0018G0021 [Candidatus Giovannonibacteria bacterium GW2011_GWA2_44_13b]|uniref:Uncharacterized protein n=2 Tax=Candidatus Giovannoniibacteriota TaxID=1752738 RepID=A0A0G1H081_9BACT|nr:MAG: hypothetical protein UW30_C0018G0021 [Candidatus Giovannonibacteria bacterium GW2011_GWA2_44_13b]OGF83258.1 MAG: hypothetical protein A2924_02225 [Candidatus Giovannonibacteria bacterium RIFCSPLOWO2_01_FULL_44_16]